MRWLPQLGKMLRSVKPIASCSLLAKVVCLLSAIRIFSMVAMAWLGTAHHQTLVTTTWCGVATVALLGRGREIPHLLASWLLLGSTISCLRWAVSCWASSLLATRVARSDGRG